MNIDLEKTILGACFYPEAVNDIVSVISAEDFKIETHSDIFRAIEELSDDGIVPDPVTVRSKDEKFKLQYLLELSEYVPTVANIKWHIDKFLEYSEKNRYLALADRLLTMRDCPVSDLREAINTTTATKQTSSSEHVSGPLKRALKGMEDAFLHRGEITGVPTGIDRIDYKLSGLHNSDMILVAARPSIGKTALGLQIADAAIKEGIPTLFISLEMSAEQLTSRLLLSKSRVDVSKARNGLFEEADWGRMTKTIGEVNESKLYIDCCSGVTMDVICAKAKAANMRHDIGLVIIDYLGLVRGKGTEYERVSNASMMTKELAKQLDIPVVALHQLRRPPSDSKPDRRPTMDELRGTGQLEQDADVIMLLHRAKKEPVEDSEIILAKNRHGETGIIPQTWNGPINRLEERKHDGYENKDY
jgi:replicative DNA helicase